MDECCICGQIAGDPARDLLHAARGCDHYDRWVPLEGRRYVVIPSIGALAEGHVLLCPRRHVRSCALLEGPEAGEMERAQATLERLLVERFGGTVQLFEHGNSTSGTRVGCSVEHAHLHFVPGAPDVWPAVAREMDWRAMEHPLDEEARGREYIRYRRANGDWFICTVDARRELPSQYMRRHLAHALGIAEEWNWREDRRFAVTAATMARLRTGCGSRPALLGS